MGLALPKAVLAGAQPILAAGPTGILPVRFHWQAGMPACPTGWEARAPFAARNLFNRARWVLEIYSCLDEGAVQGGLIGKAANDVVVFEVAPADLRPDAMRQLNFDAALHLVAPIRAVHRFSHNR